MTIEFEALDDATGLRVRDDAAGEQFAVRTDRAVDPTPASTGEFSMPVDRAVAVAASELHFPLYGSAEFLRDGDVVHRTEDAATSERLPRDTYEVDVSPPAAKTFVKVCDAAVAARYADDHLYLDVDPATRLVVGVRSHHERPAATVTTTDDPRDLMRAVSTFGSALKTHTPDRSWPTLRGHPPALRRGDHLDIPDDVTPPDTGVTIDIPPEYGAVYTVAPLAYYLGATLEAGATPRLRAAGAVREFDPNALAAEVRTCLEHVFALDGAVRSVGVYPFRHAQADTLDERVDLDYERLFALPLDERTADYLDVPRSATAGLLDWHLTADVAADPAYAPTLPHVVDELAVVRSPSRDADARSLDPEPNALDGSGVRPPDASGAGVRTGDDPSTPDRVVVPEGVDTPGHVWLADGVAADAANPTVGSFRRALDWPAGSDPLDVHVVVNDTRTADANRLSYGTHPVAETNVEVSRSLTTTELRAALAEDTDFLHFVGRVTDRGFVCPDGELDARTLAHTGVGAFFLNGCRSLVQGRALLTAGSAAGIVTVDDATDADGSEDERPGSAGRVAATLLDAGYPMYAVLEVLDRVGVDPGRYTVLGVATLALRTSVGGVPELYEFDTGAVDADHHPLTAYPYPYGKQGLGALVARNYATDDRHLANAGVRSLAIRREQLDAYLRDSPVPVLVDDSLALTSDLSTADFS